MDTNTRNFKNEVWRKVPKYTKYEASNYGRLKTFNWKGSGREVIMKPALDGSGYLRAVLKRDSDGKLCTVKVHRIIASTFLGETEGMEVNHINCIKTDNSVGNIEWCTKSENLKHAYENGLLYTPRGEDSSSSILTEKQVISIRNEFKPRVVTRKILGAKYGVSEATIKDIILRRSWKHLK